MTISNEPPCDAAGVSEAEETRLLNGQVICLQPLKGYRTAIDPVFLAAAVDAKSGDRVLDAGSGTGAASLCLASRVQGVRVTGIEIQNDYAELARKSAELSGLSERVNFVDADLTALPKIEDFREFDHVMTNPPYMEAGRGRVPPDPTKARATMESHVGLDEWIANCIRMTRSRGTFTIIHRADRLEHIMASLSGVLGQIIVFPLWPGRIAVDGTKPIRANRVIVSGRKGVKTPGILSSGIVLHEERGEGYTAGAKSVLNDSKKLTLLD